MKKFVKLLVSSNSFAKKLALFFLKIRYKKKYKLIFGKNVYLNPTVKFEGYNFFSDDSSIISSSIGFGSYLGCNTKIFNTKIGRYCSIGHNVRCIFGKHPTKDFVSTHPSFFSTLKQVGFTYTDKQLFEEHHEAFYKPNEYAIHIGNDVWLGDGATLMEGVNIGDGAIVAANSLVVKDVAPYTIVGGIPAKVIKKRFSDYQIEFLLKFQWWEKGSTWIKENAKDFVNIEKFYDKFQQN